MSKKPAYKLGRGWGVLGAVVMSLVAPVAIAGPEADALQAENEFARGNLIVALALWRKAADQGYAPAQARLGDMYDKTEEDKEAVEWYRKAAVQGNAAGEFGLGEMYAKGEGVAKDPVQAYGYVSSAAEKGYLQAMILMRELYRTGGLGVTVDPVKSAEWGEKVKQAVAREKPESEKTAQNPSADTSKK